MKHFVFLFLSLIFFSHAVYSESYGNRFLHFSQDEGDYVFADVVPPNGKSCENIPQPTKREFIQLLRLIQQGDRTAFRVTLSVAECLESGDLEDFYRAAGIFLEVKPILFLQTIKAARIADQSIQYMATMLPLDLVDNISGKLNRINNRITLIDTVNVASLKLMRGKVRNYLLEEKKNLKAIQSQQ